MKGRNGTALHVPQQAAESSVQRDRNTYEVQSVRFRYGANAQRGGDWVLKDLTFDVRQREILGIVGPNGSGKTSLLKLLARIVEPQTGCLKLFGRDLTTMSHNDVARLVGVVPQDTQQWVPFTVGEAVLMGRFPHRPHDRFGGSFGWESREDVAIAEQALVTMDIAHLARRSMTELSGGERQRAVIARALAQVPKVLLLDEPTAFLDLRHQLEICAVVGRLNEERGLTVVLISHDLNLASQYCHRVLMLKEGVVCRIGSPDEVMKPNILQDIYGCNVLVDAHPESGLPRVTLPRQMMT